jgi:hypothetical protein
VNQESSDGWTEFMPNVFAGIDTNNVLNSDETTWKCFPNQPVAEATTKQAE